MARASKRTGKSCGRKADCPAEAFDIYAVALETMSHGFCLYDAKDRVLFHNQRYLDFYELAPGALKTGMSARAVFAACAASLGLPRSVGAALWRKRQARLARRQPFDQVQHLPTGRSLAVKYRPMPAGGWVSVYEDVTEAQRLGKALRLQAERTQLAIDSMPHGLSMFDADYRMIVCNQHYHELYDLDPAIVKPGVAHQEVVRHWIERGNRVDDADMAFYTTPGALGSNTQPRTVRVVRHDGRIVEAVSRATPDGGWVTLHKDKTEQLRQEELLREQNFRFNAALNNMSQGLAMIDADHRLIVCNEQYCRMFGSSGEAIRPGMMVRDLFQIGVDNGLYPGMTADELFAQRLDAVSGGRTIVYTRELGDGRTFKILVSPMANGGWLATFEDVTEGLKLEAERVAALQDLREQHRRFDTALHYMSQGLVMVDETMKVIVCNRRYLEIFGMSDQIVKPGISMREVLAYSDALGNYHGTAGKDHYATYLKRLQCGGSYNRHLPDGRVIHINHRRMTQGGYVVTYEDVTERFRAEERISHIARHDALTGLANRLLFRERMDEGLERVREKGESMAVLCLDLDNFKTVNDTLGHPFGDRLLMAVAHLLPNVVGPDETIARLGGDEFAILLSNTNPRAAEMTARLIVKTLTQPIVVEGHEINSGVSVGVAIAPHDGTTADDLMKCADLALYQAKANGRGHFRLFEPEMDRQLQERRALELDLRKAITAGELDLCYQPLVNARTGALNGMEALLRWDHPLRGVVPPSEFVPLAEETGLIVSLGEWALRQACAQAARWPSNLKVAVNLSPVQFKSRALVGIVAHALASSGLAPARLELEITEAVMLQADELTVATLHQLRGLGARIAMDDFGTGYSSLSYLRSFPFDKIKIDRCFVSDLENSEDSGAIVKAIAGLGASLGMDVTAEGVETAAQFERVRREGCTEMQGYYFSRPLRAAQAFDLITRWTGIRAVAVA